MSGAPAILIPFGFWLIHRQHTSEILGDGQLFFFCTAIAGTTYGTLSEIGPKLEHSLQEHLYACGAALLFAIVFATYAFGAATMGNNDAKPRIAATSIWFSIGTVMLVGLIRFHLNAW